MSRVNDMEIFVSKKITKQSTITAIMDKFTLTQKQVHIALKKSPYLFWLHTSKLDKKLRDKVFYVDNNTVLHETGDINNLDDILLRLRTERQNRYYKDSYAECTNAVQLMGTWIYKYQVKIDYLTFKELYACYRHKFTYNIDNKNLFYKNREKAIIEISSMGIEII